MKKISSLEKLFKGRHFEGSVSTGAKPDDLRCRARLAYAA